MDILFDRPSRHDRVPTAAAPAEGVDVVRTPYFDSVDVDESATDAVAALEPAELVEEVVYLNEEVEHLRACIDHMLDLLEAQATLVDDVDLLLDRTRVSERRLQRLEDSVEGRDDLRRRRAEDAA